MVSSPEREEPSLSSCRILFVDDNESLRLIIPETLRRAGYIVATADGGESCLDELCQAEYDLIILDIMMEPMDGWKTLRAIRKDTAYQDIPIVILTGKLFLPAEMITYGTEVAGWIKKPIHMEQFTARIDEIVADLIEDQRIAEEKAAAGVPGDIQTIADHLRRLRVLKELFEIVCAQFPLRDGAYPEGVQKDLRMMTEMIQQEEEWCKSSGIL